MIRITELTNMLDASNAKVGSLNKAKDKLSSEIKELTIEIDTIGGKLLCTYVTDLLLLRSPVHMN